MGLPGADLVATGLDALRRGEPTKEALLVLVGKSRLRWAGVQVPEPPEGWSELLSDGPEIALYQNMARTHGKDAHSQYNALIRRLVSFERALEARRVPTELPQ